VAMVGLRRLTLLLELLRFSLLRSRLVLVERPLDPVRVLGLVERSRTERDLGGVDTAASALALHDVDPDHLRNDGALHLDAESAARTGRVPHAEQQGGWAQLEEFRRICRTRVAQRTPDGRLPERRSIEQRIAKQRVGDAV